MVRDFHTPVHTALPQAPSPFSSPPPISFYPILTSSHLTLFPPVSVGYTRKHNCGHAEVCPELMGSGCISLRNTKWETDAAFQSSV